ncbi:MAG: pyridoxine 5'-phosphate synthase [Candidatus Omnitrophota bacterium]
MPKLGVNIDHVATVRQARKSSYPDPVEAARICENAGADSIVCHLREDRRHILDQDLINLKNSVKTRLNLEMSIAPAIVDIACRVKPDQATIVPEKREEITTEGGLEVVPRFNEISGVIRKLAAQNIDVSLFIDPVEDIIKASADAGVKIVEFHTGRYANAVRDRERAQELDALRGCVELGLKLGLTVNAGHGLNYDNTRPVAMIPGMEELNIGHSIVSYAVFYGLDRAVRDMKELVS